MANLIAPDGTTFELAEGETLVGRGERQVGDPPKLNLGHLPGGLTVSRQHARLRCDSEQWYLEVERQSTNSTLVDGFALPKGMIVPLKDGSRLQLGEVHLQFRGPAAALDAADITLERGFGPAGEMLDGSLLVSVGPPSAPDTRGWVARLPARPALFDTLGVSHLTRVRPFEGLMIDAETWADEHAYHSAAARVHRLAGHGWGIVDGLEVIVDPHVPASLIVRAGVAIDATGRLLLLPEDTQLGVSVAAGRLAVVALSYAEQPTSPQHAWDGAEHMTRVVESACLTVETEVPPAPAVELARMVVAPELRDAADPTNPQPGEVDLRFRERRLLRPRPELAIAQLTYVASDTPDEATVNHRLGLRFLAREIGQTTPYRVRWAGTVELGDPLPPVALAYFTASGGFELTSTGLERVRDFVHNGGVLLADACQAADGWPEFVASVAAVAEQLGIQLATVGRWHPLLLARHVLVRPPLAEPADGALLEGGGIVLTCADYGCAWQGGPEAAPLQREQVRAALELGTNAAVFGQQRRRPLDVLDLEA